MMKGTSYPIAQFKINDKTVNSNTVNVYDIPITNALHKSIIDNNQEVGEKFE